MPAGGQCSGRGNAIKSTFDVNEKKTPLSKRPRAICVQRITLLLCFVSIGKILEGNEESLNHGFLTRIHSRFRITPSIRLIVSLLCFASIDRKDSIERNLRNSFAEDEGIRRTTFDGQNYVYGRYRWTDFHGKPSGVGRIIAESYTLPIMIWPVAD